ncbi:MAG: isocitrate lyase/phosphoenolpyruvate mutase family protein [Rhodospirillales bacterium]|nr:isocitrate lyase/phosphoenolpyruvate mutase family protein [Rhodospirillales bacterium]
MPVTLAEKAARFRALHAKGKTFVMPNAWDPGSARLLESLGFEALATTSAGINYANGLPDGPDAAPYDLTMARHEAIAKAVKVPVNGDLENGYGHSPEAVASCIGDAIGRGMAGCGIEDYTGNPAKPYYDIDLAADRIAAAREAADNSGTAFTLTARAECFLYGHDDPLPESIRRLNRFREAGADCLYAPGPTDDATLKTFVAEVDGPLNVVVGMGGGATVAHMAELGITRISTGGSLFRGVYGTLMAFGKAMADEGMFPHLERAMPDGKMMRLASGRS